MSKGSSNCALFKFIYLVTLLILLVVGLCLMAADLPGVAKTHRLPHKKHHHHHHHKATPTPTNQLSCSRSKATGATGTQTRDATAAPYNAVGDGVTDNYTAIQNALNDTSSAGGGIVTLPAGTFITSSHLIIKSNVKLMGVGPTTIIKAGPDFLNTTGPRGGYPLITTNGASNVTIANLTADQSGDTLNGNVEGRLAEYLVDIRSSTNVVVAGIYTRNPFTYSIAAVESSKFCIKNSNTQVATSGLYNQLDGIHILDSSFGDIINNYVDQRYNGVTDGDDGLVAHTINGSTHDVKYAGNTVRGGAHGSAMQIAVGDYSIYNLFIQNNEMYGSPDGIRTGYYDNKTGALQNIIIGGSSMASNYIHDNVLGIAFPDGGDAIYLGYDAPTNAILTNIVVTYNRACNAGAIVVPPGTSNLYANNVVTGSC